MVLAIAKTMRVRFSMAAGGPKGRRPAPAPRKAGASPPPGRALASAALVETVLRGIGRCGWENAMRFLIRPIPEQCPRHITVNPL